MEKNKLTLKKTANASQSYGRSADNTRTPGHYDVFSEGVKIGTIFATAARPYQNNSWEFESIDHAINLIASTRGALLYRISSRFPLNEKA